MGLGFRVLVLGVSDKLPFAHRVCTTDVHLIRPPQEDPPSDVKKSGQAYGGWRKSYTP